MRTPWPSAKNNLILVGRSLKESLQVLREPVVMSTREGGTWVMTKKPTGTIKQKGKRQNLMDKAATGSVATPVYSCKYCDKVCATESGLTNHINNVHQERQFIFRCLKCGLKFNIFTLYIYHLKSHKGQEYKCHECGQEFTTPHLLAVHSPMQCPLCSRTFKSETLLESHVGEAHGKALSEEFKKCLFCDAAFTAIPELEEHTNIHKYYSCEICFAGFVSDVTLIKHKIQDHPQGPAVSQATVHPDHGQATPEDQGVIITGVVDPELDAAMRWIKVPI